jgi:hypothetical protein
MPNEAEIRIKRRKMIEKARSWYGLIPTLYPKTVVPSCEEGRETTVSGWIW